MDSKARARPNHYEMLGLDPKAGADQIAQAFARLLRRPGTIGDVARLSLAYETLRDPAKRRAYDASIGIGQPPPRPLHQWSSGALFGSPYSRMVTATPARQAAAAPSAPPAPAQSQAPARSQPQAEESGEPPLPSFLATALRDIAGPDPIQSAAVRQPAPEQRTRSAPEREPRQAAAEPRPAIRRAEDCFDNVEEGAIDWRRTGLAAGALVAVAGLFGVWAGWEASNDPQPPPQTVGTPKLRPAPAFPSQIASAPEVGAAVQRGVPVRAAPAANAPRARPATQAARLPEERPLEPVEIAGMADASEAAPVPAEQPPAALVEAAVKAASMPLPNRVIARTIDRIGYSCGEVASTAAVDGGASGVFKVSCTSGQTFQARPVGGRYRFRRWGRQ